MKTTTVDSTMSAPETPRFDSPLSRWITFWQLQLVNGTA